MIVITRRSTCAVIVGIFILTAHADMFSMHTYNLRSSSKNRSDVANGLGVLQQACSEALMEDMSNEEHVLSSEQTLTQLDSSAGFGHTESENSKVQRHKNNLSCPICSRSFATLEKMVNHALLHVNKAWFSCPSCDGKFVNRHKRNQHCLAAHRTSITKYPDYENMKNQEKEIIFKELGILPLNNMNCAPWITQPRPIKYLYICCFNPMLCQKLFRDKFKLYDHLLRHLKTGKFACPVCTRTYNCTHDRNAHLQKRHRSNIFLYPKTRAKDSLAIARIIKKNMYKELA